MSETARCTLIVVVAACAAVLAPAAASGQVVTQPTHLARMTVPCQGQGCESPVAVLSRHMTAGDMVKLQGYAMELVHSLALHGSPEIQAAIGDVRRNYYRLVWLCQDEKGASSVQSVVVHEGEAAAVHTVPGISLKSRAQLIDVLVSNEPNAVLETQYASTPIKDPLSAQIADFIKRTDVTTFLSALPLARGEAGVQTTYALSRAMLPLERADIKVRDTVVQPGSVTSLKTESVNKATSLKEREARQSPCAQALADADAAAIAKTLADSTCSVPDSQPNGLTPSEVRLCRASLADALQAAYAEQATCHDNPPAPGDDPVLKVDEEFREMVRSMSESSKSGDSKLTNLPPTRYSFGLLFAASIGTPHYSRHTVRAKIGANGTIILDPLPTAVSMAIVNIHPHAYNSDADSATRSERLRLFLGTAIPPSDFGIGGGAGFMIVRGLSVNVGWVNLFVRTPRSGYAIGQTPPAGKTPLTVGSAGVWFAGLSYSFSK